MARAARNCKRSAGSARSHTRASAPRFAAESRNFLMRSREEPSLKTDALRYLADALSEDIAATPELKILAEERDDSAQRPPLALAFEELLADAKALARQRGTVPGISRADALSADTGTPRESLLREAPENLRDSQAPATEARSSRRAQCRSGECCTCGP